MAIWIEKNAYIWNLGQLSTFPVEFPGIYSQLKAFGGLEKLDRFVECSRKLLSSGREISWIEVDQEEISLCVFYLLQIDDVVPI